MAVSSASIWQKKSCVLAVGVGPVGQQAGGGGRDADVAALPPDVRTRRRMSLMSLFSSIRSWVHSVSKASCFRPSSCGWAMGTK